MPIIANSVVAVSATVQPTISFALTDNTIFFGDLTTATACFAVGSTVSGTCTQSTPATAFDATVATNAPSGYTLSVQGATLTSGANEIDALGSNTASSPASEQFGIRATSSGGAGTVSSPYAASGYAYTGTAGAASTLATSTSESVTTTYSLIYIANISAITEAGSYSTNHTYVATGNF
jgi:hypothetical protein